VVPLMTGLVRTSMTSCDWVFSPVSPAIRASS
jgi:hypothetical protein